MRLFVALLFPPLVFFTIGRPWAGVLCLMLYMSIIGWLPAAIWAVYTLNQYNVDRKIAFFRREQAATQDK